MGRRAGREVEKSRFYFFFGAPLMTITNYTTRGTWMQHFSSLFRKDHLKASGRRLLGLKMALFSPFPINPPGQAFFWRSSLKIGYIGEALRGRKRPGTRRIP
jgi:hypothetical protein